GGWAISPERNSNASIQLRYCRLDGCRLRVTVTCRGYFESRPNAKTEQTLPPNGEVKRDAAGPQMGGGIRGARVGSQVETRKVEPRWHRVRAKQVVIVNHRHH